MCPWPAVQVNAAAPADRIFFSSFLQYFIETKKNDGTNVQGHGMAHAWYKVNVKEKKD